MTAAVASIVMGLGLGLLMRGILRARLTRPTLALADLLEQPGVAVAAPAPPVARRRIVEATVGFVGSAVERFDPSGALATALARARIPLRPGEYVITTLAAALVVAAFVLGVTASRVFTVMAVAGCIAGSVLFLRRRVNKLRSRFESQLPPALTLIASSLSAGHTFLRAIHMMCQEADPPISEEFAQVVAETRLGAPLVDSLGRMAERLQIRDVDWCVQAIRIQQTVGGRLAELLHILADFIRSRDEVRQEIKVLTAEGRMSAWVLAGLAPFLLLAIQVLNPDYLKPMLQGWGLIVLAAAGSMVVAGILVIFRMVKIEV